MRSSTGEHVASQVSAPLPLLPPFHSGPPPLPPSQELTRRRLYSLPRSRPPPVPLSFTGEYCGFASWRDLCEGMLTEPLQQALNHASVTMVVVPMVGPFHSPIPQPPSLST